MSGLKLKDVWDKLPDLPHTRKYLDEKSGLRMFEICGKKYQETVKLDYIIERLEDFEKRYGQRARDVEENKNLDFKAISHAMRYGLQLKELFETKDIKFPLTESKYLTSIKLGELDYKTEVSPVLERVIARVEVLAENSSFPKTADREYWEDFVKDYYEYIIKSS